MSEIKLLPCPFCGGDNLGFYHNHLFRDGYEVRCYDCHFGLQESRTKEEAIKQWNTRKPMKRIVERLEEYNQSEDDFKKIIDTNREIPNPTVSRTIGRIEAFNKAIEIVKEEGGIK